MPEHSVNNPALGSPTLKICRNQAQYHMHTARDHNLPLLGYLGYDTRPGKPYPAGGCRYMLVAGFIRQRRCFISPRLDV